jgi:DHA2 family multidrug resistance protein-like MFS transporter
MQNVADGLATPHRYWVMACILLATTLTNLDAAIANVALPTIAHSLGTSEGATVWVVNIYQLTVAVCLLPAAAMGEILGLKRVYAFGLVMFTMASLGCALSPNIDALIAARLFQGIGGACVAALSPAMIRSIYPRRLIAHGFALLALIVAVSAALGPTVAALILSIASWPWLFLVNVPFCLVTVPLFQTISPATPGQEKPFDYSGAVLNALAFGLIVIGVGSLSGEHTVASLLQICAGLVCSVVFVLQQRQRITPMLPLDLLRIPVFALSAATSVCSYIAQIMAFVSLPFLFQTVLHRSTVATGLLITPWPVLVAFAAPVAGRLSARYPASVLGSIGLALLAVGLLLLAALPSSPSDLDIAWRMALCGVGFGLFQTPNNTALMTAGPVTRNAAASAMVAVARTVGWSFGSALVALMFVSRGADAALECLGIGAGFAALGVVISGVRVFAPRPA